MSINLPLADDKKLTVIFRVEPGCLGPEGKDHVEGFCQFAQNEFNPIDADFIKWSIVPMYDKSLDEIDYKIGERGLTHDKVNRYLGMFEKEQDAFEEEISSKISDLIVQHIES